MSCCLVNSSTVASLLRRGLVGDWVAALFSFLALASFQIPGVDGVVGDRLCAEASVIADDSYLEEEEPLSFCENVLKLTFT